MRLQKRSTYSKDKNGIGEDAVSIVVADGVVYLPLEDLIDRERGSNVSIKRAGATYKGDRTLRGMLNNPNFVNKTLA